MASIQGIYIALFGRPADPLGLQYFNDVTGEGADLTAIGDLAATAEYQDRFEGMSNVQIINSIYQSLFGRDADLAGLTFFAQALQDGTFNINNIAIAILDGAQGDDLATVNNKIEAANLFTASLDTGAEVVAYQGADAAEAGRDFLSGITEDEATIPSQADVDAAIAEIAGQEPVGNSFTLTDAVGEQVVGTAQADTFSAVVDGATPANGTFNVGDVINGGAGTDTLNLLVSAGGTLPAGATVSGVEIVNVNYADGASLGALNSSSFGGVQQLWQIDTNVTTNDFQNVTVGAGVTAGFRSTNVTGSAVAVGDTVTAAAGVTAIGVALDGVATASTVTVAETTATNVSTVDVSGTVAAAGAGVAGTVNVAGAAATLDVDTLNVSMSSNATVAVGANLDDLNTINASGSTGNITLTLAAAPDELSSATFGSGNDTFTVSTGSLAANGTLAINMGSGNDTLVFTGAGSAAEVTTTITLGAGNDTLDVNGLTNVTAEGSFAADLITVADFNADQDVLDLAGLGNRDILVNTELANISAAATLEAAADLAAQYTSDVAGDYSVFNYGGNAYVYVSGAAATTTLANGDGLMQVVGLQVEDLNAQNFVA